MDLSNNRQSLDSLDLPFRDDEFLDRSKSEGKTAPLAARRIKLSLNPTCSQFFVLTLLGSLGILLFMFLKPDPHTKARPAPTGREFGDCGTDQATAIANGCIFDNLSYAWARPECHHAALLSRYQARHRINYYNSSTLSPEFLIPIEEIYAGKYLSTFADQEQHPIHCAFMLAKLHEAYMSGGPTDNLVREQEHTHHCTEIMLDGWLHEVKPCLREGGCISLTTMKFTSCGYA